MHTATTQQYQFRGCFRLSCSLHSSSVASGKCAWIGTSNVNTDTEYRWIELPPNYGDNDTNGPSLMDGHTNFPSGTNITPNVGVLYSVSDFC